MARTAVVAGVGPGLGASVAERFAEEGCAVALLARSESYLNDFADRLGAETPEDALALPTDLADPMTIDHSFERIRERVGPVDVLVNHASAATWDGLLEQDPAEFRRALAVGPEAAGDDYLDPDAIADAYWTLVEQDRSAWTLELDLRPHVEEF